MVTVKKNTIDREAFEREMSTLKDLVRSIPEAEEVTRAINKATQNLIEYVEESKADSFAIPEWLTTRLKPEEIGDYVGW